MAVIFLIALLMVFSQCGHSYKIRINLYIIVEYTIRARLSRLFLSSQFYHEYLLVMINIHCHILFKTTALKSEVKASLFCFQKAKAELICFITNEEHSNEV